MLFSDENHFFVQGKQSRFFRIRKGKQLSPAHFNEVVKDPKMRCSGAVNLFRRFTYMSIEGMMNLYKYIDAIERKVIPAARRAFPDGRGKLH